MSAGSYAGRILHVDLTHSRWTWTPLPQDDELRLYLGGSGLALYLLRERLLGASHPLRPAAAPLILMTGALTGTAIPSSSDFSVATVETRGEAEAAVGHSHGYWGPRLKFSGFDGMIIEGEASRPVFLEISPAGNCFFREAGYLWGKGTRETENRVLHDLGGSQEEMSVLTIGPAGEAGLSEALLKNDRHYGVSRGSVGSLLGKKKLKAIAVRGTSRPAIARPRELEDITTRWSRRLFQEPSGNRPPKGRLLRNAGFLRRETHLALNDPGTALSPKVESLLSAAASWKVTPFSSFNCEIACAFEARITSGSLQGITVRMGGGSKCLEGDSERLGIEDAGAALALTDHCEEVGWQPSRAVRELAGLVERFESGALSAADLGGIVPRRGDVESALELLEFVLAHPAVLPEETRGGAGNAPRLYREDPSLPVAPAPAAGSREEETFPKDLLLRWIDCCGVCQFAVEGIPDVPHLLARALGAATGWEDFTVAEGRAVSRRVVEMEEEFRRLLSRPTR